MNHRFRPIAFSVALFTAWLFTSFDSQLAAQSTQNQQASASQSDIKKWIQDLHAERSVVRQDANRQLIKLGSDAVTPLVEAIEPANEDQRLRIVSVLIHLGSDESNQATADAIRVALRDLAMNGSPPARSLAIGTLTRLGVGMEDSAVKELTDAGAKITSQYKSNVKEYGILLDNRWHGTPSDLEKLLWVGNARSVRLRGSKIDDAVIEIVSLMPRVTFMEIRDATVTNEAIKHLIKMNRLVQLEILYCGIDDSCVDEFSKFRRVKQLKLFGTNITNAGAQSLRNKIDCSVDFRLGGFLGVNYNQDPSDEMVIISVVRGSGAQKAGISPGDVIVKYEDKQINGPDDFRGTVSNNRPGDVVEVVIRRGGREMTKSVTLGRYLPAR